MTTLYPKTIYEQQSKEQRASRTIDQSHRWMGEFQQPADYTYVRELDEMHHENILAHAAKMRAIYQYKGTVQPLATSPRQLLMSYQQIRNVQ